MSAFVTDTVLIAACEAYTKHRGGPAPADTLHAVLDAVAPLWLAHVQQAHEHLGHYTEAAKAAEIERQMADKEE